MIDRCFRQRAISERNGAMRFVLGFAMIVALSTSIDATATPIVTPQPFAAAPVSDDILSASFGMGPQGRYGFTDDVVANVDRQAASLRNATIATWSIEFATPLIAANAARAGLLD